MTVRSRAAVTRAWLQANASAVFSSAQKTTTDLYAVALASRPWDPADGCWSEWRPNLRPTLRLMWPGSIRRFFWAFTDGSTSECRGQPSGCGVVLTEFGVVVHEFGFPCRASGSNYLAEAAALLAALLAVPAEFDVNICTDALSVKHSVERGLVMDWLAGALTGTYAITQRSRVLTAARPVLNVIRAVLSAKRSRGGVVRLHHVYSHTGGHGFSARMNDRADALANGARIAARYMQIPLDLYGEEVHRVHIGRIPVVGPFRPAILRKLQAGALDAWGSRPRGCADMPACPGPMEPLVPTAAHSARLVAADGRGVAELAAVVAKTHDPGLIKFLALAVPEWLPVERRLHRADRSAGRGEHCKLCRTGAGEVLLPETVRHLFECECPGMQAALARLVAEGCTALVAGGVRVRGPSAVPPEVGEGGGTSTRWIPVWFDPRRLFWMEVLVRAEWEVEEYDRRDPLGAVLGVLPPCLDRLLEWSRGTDGWARRSLKVQAALRVGLQLSLIRGAWRLYRTRCGLLDAWWRAPARAPARDALAHVVAGRALRRARSRQRRVHDLFELRQAAKCARRMARPVAAGDSYLARAGVPALPVAGLALSLEVDVAATAVGSNAAFALKVRNVGGSVAVGGVVYAPLPAGYGFIAADSVRFDGGTGIWSLSALGPGDSVSVRVTAVLRPTGSRVYAGQVLRRSARRRVPIDYMAPLVYSPADDPMLQFEGALYAARTSLPWY